jgi:hypothetical protein
LFAEGLRLLFQEGGEGAFGQASGRGTGELFHGSEVGVQSRAVVAEGPSGNDFAPAGCQVTDFLEEIRR